MPFDEKKSWLVPGAARDVQSITRDGELVGQRTIGGVTLRDMRPVNTGYGYLTEMLRGEWLDGNNKVDQIFVSTLKPGAVSAWHAHAVTTDRLFVAAGMILVVLFDNREGSETRGQVNEFRISSVRPGLLIMPPRVWHGVKNVGDTPAQIINAVDSAYSYESPDHWRAPENSAAIPYSFA